MGTVVYLGAEERDRTWFAVAFCGEDLVATATGSNHERALFVLRRCIPESLLTEETDSSPFLTTTVDMLAELERGVEQDKHFTLSREHLSESARCILTAAAAIPIGYVTTYGDVAKAAGSEARAVGRVMATNPLYPIVPCHRVVGADMDLVGYGGKQDRPALTAKLGRIVAELRGVAGERYLPVPTGTLHLYPGEYVVENARKNAAAGAAQRTQLELF